MVRRRRQRYSAGNRSPGLGPVRHLVSAREYYRRPFWNLDGTSRDLMGSCRNGNFVPFNVSTIWVESRLVQGSHPPLCRPCHSGLGQRHLVFAVGY